MNHWLLKTEPEEYSWEDLEREGRAPWNGVRNATALIHLRKMKAGDEAFIYHTGKQKQVVGVARVVSQPYPDPEAGDERYVMVDVEPLRRLDHPVTLKAIKADTAFAEFALVKISRLSVMPVPAALWNRIAKMAG
jgi:predicted RNA-binding protein with PUA-like domain